jgi:hypothetical protein
MNNHILQIALCFSIFLLPCIFQSKAQGFLEKIAVGGNFGTYGGGLTLATTLSPHFHLITGLDYLGYTDNKGSNYDVSNFEMDFIVEKVGVSDVSIKMDALKLNFVNFKALVDYYPKENGLISFCTGFYIGNNYSQLNISVPAYKAVMDKYGYILDEYHFWEQGYSITYDIDDIVIRPEQKSGSFAGRANLGNIIKPYFGLGCGRTIANGRLAMKLDLGVIVQGRLSVESDYILSGVKNAEKLIEDQIPSLLHKFWPMVNLTISYRIK